MCKRGGFSVSSLIAGLSSIQGHACFWFNMAGAAWVSPTITNVTISSSADPLVPVVAEQYLQDNVSLGFMFDGPKQCHFQGAAAAADVRACFYSTDLS